MKRVCSIFSQILQLMPRDRFEAAVREHRAERHARGFSSWGQFVAMLFCQLAQAKSLREITEGLQASEGKLKHLGLPEAPARDNRRAPPAAGHFQSWPFEARHCWCRRRHIRSSPGRKPAATDS